MTVRTTRPHIRLTVTRKVDDFDDDCHVEWFDNGTLVDDFWFHPTFGWVDGPFSPRSGWPAAIEHAVEVTPNAFIVFDVQP